MSYKKNQDLDQAEGKLDFAGGMMTPHQGTLKDYPTECLLQAKMASPLYPCFLHYSGASSSGKSSAVLEMALYT